MARKKSQPEKGRAHPEDAMARRKNIAKKKKQQKRKVGTSLRNMTMSTEALRKHLKVKRTPNNNLSTRGANMDDGYRGWLSDDGMTIRDIRGFHLNPGHADGSTLGNWSTVADLNAFDGFGWRGDWQVET
eukprot:SAG22_NODE_424_length_10663_cov_93.402026_10_plen_130_part_00